MGRAELTSRSRCGFTLIELLIVVAIISVLSAIAVPNFLEAQTRSKISRVKADMRAIATGLESYHVDWNGYPPPSSNGHGARLWRLSEPILYMTDATRPEVFFDEGIQKHPPYGYVGRNELVNVFWNNDGLPGNFSGRQHVDWWLLRSSGPDNDRDGGAATDLNDPESRHEFLQHIYDPTNGSISGGDIWRAGGEPTGQGRDSITFFMR